MSKVIKLKKGLDIKLKGEAENLLKNIERCDSYAVKPTDFRLLTPKLAVKAGDQVKAGDVLFIDKYRPEVKFTSPVSGTVETVNRGERRKLLEVVVKADAQIQYKDFGAADVNKLSRDEIIEKLLDSGVWPMIKQRPYDIIATPADMPKAIFVSGFDSAPLAPDFDITLADELTALQSGIDCLKKLCGKNANLNLKEGTPSTSVFQAEKRGCKLFRRTTPGRKCRNPDSSSEPDQQRGNRLGGKCYGSCHYRTIIHFRKIRRPQDDCSRRFRS